LQLKVINSPFNEEQAEILNSLLPTLTESQKIWLSGYLAAAQFSPVHNPTLPISDSVTILYGSQTGNAKGLAKKAEKTLANNGFQVTLSSMNDFKFANVKKIQNLLIFVSTHGEGEPPDQARSFHEYLHGRRAPKLDGLRFSVLSLGDSSYEFFCQTGKEFDSALETLGGKRLHPRVDCDLDYDEQAEDWLGGVVNSLREGSAPVTRAAASEAVESVYSRINPFKAEVLESINLNGHGSKKETRHLELSLEGSGLTYEPGDSLGIYPENDPGLVALLLKLLPWDPETVVTVNKQGEHLPLNEALTSYYEITVVTKPLLEKVSQLSENEDLKRVSASNFEGRDLVDLVRDFGAWGNSAQEFVSVLRKMPARLYSIASSIAANPDEVHVTIGAVRYDAHGRERKGVCSIFCAEGVQPGDSLSIYIQQNDGFKLPENHDTPIIMVGPGTGVAPFRSFMQEREERGAEGKAWLFFGDQHFVTDFLYQTEWQRWIKAGVLTKMDVAFSRDGAEKVYVQHKMLEQSRELYEWLEAGAAFYICGDQKKMAHDVHNTLLEIIQTEGCMTREEAEAYLADMQQQKRYQRDVY
jgi:sulfite reductase (NADPH) flavoprotein alpha-component